MGDVDYNKYKSRTFWFTVVWTAFVPISIGLQIFTKIKLPVESIITFAGSLTVVYVGGNKLYNTIIDKEKAKV